MSESNDYPLYEYEVIVRQVVEGLQVVEATDAESAKEQAMQHFCMDIPDHSELDVSSCKLIWSEEGGTEAEKARKLDDAKTAFKIWRGDKDEH